jgi:hypothetical protein
MVGICLRFRKSFLPALLALVLLTGPAAAHPGQFAFSAGPIAAALPDADHEHGHGCAQDAAGLHCTASGCAQPILISEQSCPVVPADSRPRLTRARPLASLASAPVLHPPIFAAGA